MGDKTEMMKKARASTRVSTDTFNDVEIEPLSGKPFFHVTLCRSHVNNPYQLVVSSEITRFLPCKKVPVILTRGRRNWQTHYDGGHPKLKRFDLRSWKEFVADNALKVGDVCLFELLACTDPNIQFKVQVLRGDLPPVLLKAENGSIDNPLVVD